MTNADLHQKIQDLHGQLQANPQLDAATVESLKKLMAEITDVVNVEASELEDMPQIRTRLKSMIEQFEGEHPNLTVALTQISEFLAHIGI